jgi:serine/threonine protein kinase
VAAPPAEEHGVTVSALQNDGRFVVRVPPDDHRLASLVGTAIPAGDVTYRLIQPIGVGSMSAAFFAMRSGPNGELPVVVKVTLPTFLLTAGAAAALAMRKEAVALGRLNAVVPPNPFVVRYIDVGDIELDTGRARVQLPWIAIEYVHGGSEGTTLVARVEQTIAATRHAFDPKRAERAIQCLTSGLGAIHALQIVHRDLKPENVLCCGSGADEILKIADFGIARSLGMKDTFGYATLGTLGYAPPEQNGADPTKVGPWSDVYALAAVFYFLLTGREYFKIHDPLAAFRGDLRPQTRMSVLDSPALHPEFRTREEVCHALDRVFAEATSPSPEQRPQTAEVLSWRVLGALRLDQRPRRTGAIAPVRAPLRDGRAPELAAWSWSIAGRPMADLVVRSVAWNGDGRALAATDRGLAFWDGTQWAEVSTRGWARPHGIRFVRKIATGQWLVGGDGATMARFQGTRIVDVVEGPEPTLSAVHASGDVDDLAVFVFADPAGAPSLYCICGGRWLEPLVLDGVDVVTALARIADDRWLVVGRARDGAGWLGTYHPLRFRIDPLPSAGARTWLGAAALADAHVGVACGLDGKLAWIDGSEAALADVREASALAAVAIDATGRAWVGGTGVLFSGAQRAPFLLGWRDRSFQAPFASIYADDGIVSAVSVDGGVVEGRLDRAAVSQT